MELKELLEQLKSFEGTDEYENYISGLLTADRVNKYLASDEGKKYVDPIADQRYTKGLETWKKNNLDALVNAKVKELYPDVDPKDASIAALKAEIEQIKAESARKDLTNKAFMIANEKGLPVDLVDYFVGKDEETTTANMGKLESAFTSALSAAVKDKLKDGSYVPPDGGKTDVDGVTAAFQKLNPNLKL